MPNSISDAEPVDAFQTRFWDRYVRPAHPERPNPLFHVSPVVDALAYHFSWAWVLVPMLFAGGDPLRDSFPIYAFVAALSFAHRHVSLPYAYLDADVFRAHRRRLTWFPLACVAALVATWLYFALSSANLLVIEALQTVFFVAFLWNVWHVFMQKYGILRLYAAKDPAPVARKTPGWVDRWFLFGWFPLYASYLLPGNADRVLVYASAFHAQAVGLLAFAQAHRAWLLAPSAVFAAAGVITWLAYEWRAHRWRNPARLSAGAGQLLLSTSLFWADLVKAYVAFGFSHAVEYVVFVVAFQARRYRHPRRDPSWNERLVSRPVLWYGLSLGALATIAVVDVWWASAQARGLAAPRMRGLPLTEWIFVYSAFESLVHFHLDGFLWKMRAERTRSELGIPG